MSPRILASLASVLLAVAAPVLADKTAGNVVDDSTIASTVKTTMLGTKGVPSTKINVEVYKGVVLLSGFVEKQEEKDKAGEIAKGVDGVKEVRNEVAVTPATSMGTKLDDTVLVGKVKTALIDADEVKAGQINVEARAGIVQLGGFVKSNAMRDRAVEVARKVEGVKRVDDALFVKPE